MRMKNDQFAVTTGGKLARMAALAMLLGTAACQQSPAEQGQGGMFGGFGSAVQNQIAPPAGNQQAAAPVAAPAMPAQPTAPSAAPMPGPSVPTADPGTAPAGPTVAGREDRRIRVNNRSGQIVREIRGSAASQRNYGPDRIPQGVLADGGTVIVDFADGSNECVYDLLVVFADGTRRDQGGVNVCRVVDFTITPTGTAVR